MSAVETLNDGQKAVIISYLLSGPGKGFFEDCPEFFEGVTEEEFDARFPDLKEAAYVYVSGLKKRLLKELGHGGPSPVDV